jgi:hypothetical protein
MQLIIGLPNMGQLSASAKASERALLLRANEFHMGPQAIRIRDMLDRPIGSVRWKGDARSIVPRRGADCEPWE